MSLNLDIVEKVSEQVAREVGARIRDVRLTGPESVTHKGRDDLVTEIDMWSEQRIKAAVLAEFPDHHIIGEETQEKLVAAKGLSLEEISKEGMCWVVDPLDGTSNFVSGIPYSCVSIGLLANGERAFGLIYDPYRDELFVARRGEGARLNGKTIQMREQETLLDAVVITGFTAARHKNWEIYREVNNALIDNCHKCRIHGAAALDSSWVAAGRADVFFQYGLRCWDVAAASLILEEAGARVACIRQLDQPYSIFSESILAAHPSLFEQVSSLAVEADARGRASASS